MEERFIEIEEKLKKMTLEIEALQRENGAIKWRDAGFEGGASQDYSKQLDKESQSEVGSTLSDQEEKKRINDNLRDLMDKYEKMAKWVGMSSSVNNLLSGANLPYGTDIMVAPLSLKFKALHIDLYDDSKFPIELLETLRPTWPCTSV